ncbi:right-handed parallel beta-helix repeat-containing protein, partial [bacterium]|nr:right-handed parallel beta-helix repeat-containing protein [bacterium]
IYLNRYVPDQPLPKETLNWRVRAIAYGEAPGAWSEPGSFSVIPCDETVEVEYDPASDNHQPAVQAAIDRAVSLNKDGKSVEVVFPKGLYRGRGPADAFFTIENANGLIVNGNGSTVHLMEATLSFGKINGSRKVSIQGFTIDFPEQMVFTQGRVLKADAETGEVEVEISPGFPTYDNPFQRTAANSLHLLDPKIDGQLKRAVGSSYGFNMEKIRKVEDRRFILQFNAPSYNVDGGKTVISGGDPRLQAHDFEPGDRFVHQNRGGSTLIYANASENVTCFDLTNYGIGGLHYAAIACSEMKLLHCRSAIKEGRWWEGNADGVHMRANEIGPWIEASGFKGIGDDAVALYSRPMIIREAHPGGVANRLLVKPGHFDLEPGNEVSLFHPETGAILIEANVTKVEKVGTDWQVQFDREMPAGLDTEGGIQYVDQIWNRSKSCGDFVVRHCRFEGIRRFGSVFRARRGVIEDNLYQGTSSAAILFLNEAQYPNGLYASDIIIRNNTIRDCAVGRGAPGIICMLFKRRGPESFGIEPAESYGPNGILIENNTISDCRIDRILELWSTRDVVLRKNTVNGQPLQPTNEEQVRLLHVDDVRWLSE